MSQIESLCVIVFSLTVVKLILINSDNRPLMTPKITIVNKILIEKEFINNIPKWANSGSQHQT